MNMMPFKCSHSPSKWKKYLFVLSALSVSVAGSSLWLWKGGNYFSISLNISARAISDIIILLLIGTFYLLIAGRTTAILPSLAFVSTPEDIDVGKLVDNHKSCGEDWRWWLWWKRRLRMIDLQRDHRHLDEDQLDIKSRLWEKKVKYNVWKNMFFSPIRKQ